MPFDSLTRIFVPGSRGVSGMVGPMDLKRPFGEYFGIWSNWRNCTRIVSNRFLLLNDQGRYLGRKVELRVSSLTWDTFCLTTAGGDVISICVMTILRYVELVPW